MSPGDDPSKSVLPREIPNCDQCGKPTHLLTVISRLGDSPTYRIFECQSCNVLKWIAEQIT
jgi:DNA-directed RNA polymerase subunit M/transcription elongation factor TFIIS